MILTKSLNNLPTLLLCLFLVESCAQPKASDELTVEKIIIDEADEHFGYYMSVKPKGEIKAVMVLFPGFGQKSEDIFRDTDLHKVAYENGIMTVGFSGKMRFSADDWIQEKLSNVLKDVKEKTEVAEDNFFLGGFSAGGVIALRYAELCYEFQDKFPVQPKAVFMADSPVDIYYLWSLKLEDMKNNNSEIAVQEGQMLERVFNHYYGGTPSEKPENFIALSPFSIDTTYGQNEIFLKNVAVRAYHDVDISWRIKNRNQTARFDNYIATSELINRLNLLGNDQAEFIQTFQTGYRKNGDRHPHSWSIIDAEDCVEWLSGILE